MKILETRNELIESFKKELIIAEVGVFKGEFSKIILEVMKPKELHLIDIFEGDMCSGDKDGNNIIWTELNEEYIRLKKEYEKTKEVYIHKGKSHTILEEFGDGYFDLIYIDGDHSYNGVKIDLEMSYKKIKPGGLICGHDYISPRFDGVVNAVNEFCEENNLSINYLTKDGCPTYCITKK
jgi:hypothetical protein